MSPHILPRRGRRGFLIAAAVSVLLSMLLIGPLSRSAAGAATTPAVRSGGPTITVTLITGDVVSVTETAKGEYATDIQRPGGARGGVHAQTIGDDLFVFPDEVMPYLASGTLDRRLFDVTTLIEAGYDDQHADGIPLIVSYADAKGATKPVPAGTTKVRPLPSVRGSAVKAAKRQMRKVWDALTPSTTTYDANPKPVLADGIQKIWLDGKVHVDLSDSTAQIGAPDAWSAGYDGKGVKVAVLDTGVDLGHPDLAGRVDTTASFVPGQTVDDGHGHGTHVASTIAGSGAASGGKEKGVAPGADLIVGKVLANEGYGEDSWIIAGMEWAAGQGARVVSMSLGGNEPSDGSDPLSTAVNQITAEKGTLFVIAAGNAGAEAWIAPPGAADAALTVAAVDSADQLADFSSRGPRYGDYSLKPDIAAPGVDILAAKAGGTAADGYYESMSGTSMATPHVAGAAVILAQHHPDWHAAELKNALMSTAKHLDGYTAYQVGSGRVDIPAGLNATVTATGSAYFGFQEWGHVSPTPIDRTITYTNTADSPVSLDLAVDGEVAGGPYDTDPHADEGTPAPGVFTLSASTLVVPAHGTASVTAIAHPDLGSPGHRYLGEIIATDGTTAETHTTLGLYIEEERYELTLSVKDRSGDYVSDFLMLQRFGQSEPDFVMSGPGPTSVRLRRGVYSLWTHQQMPGSHGADAIATVLMGDPEIVLDRDRTVTLDARKAVEATAVVPKKTENRLLIMDWYRSDGGDSVINDQYILPPWSDEMYVLPTKKVTQGSFEYESRWRKAYPLLTITDRSKELSFLGQPGSPLYDGKKQVEAVYAGNGGPEDYQGRNVHGKAVVVTRSDSLSNTQRAQAAASAGADLLIVVNDSAAKYMEWAGNDDGTFSGVTVVSMTSTTGSSLVNAASNGELRLGLEGVPSSAYTYDLVDPHPDRIPVDLSYKPQPKDLATVEMRFHGDTAVRGGEFRLDYRPYRRYSAGVTLSQDMPGTRIDYLSAQPGTTWRGSAIGGRELELVSIGSRVGYQPGSRQKVDWFGAVARPRDNAAFGTSYRTAYEFQFNVQPWSDGEIGHAGYMQWGDQLTFRVLQDGVEIAKTEGWAQGHVEGNPDGVTHYTLDLDARRENYRLSPRTHTVWEIASPHVESSDNDEKLPVLQLDYAIDTDMSGNTRGGPQTIGIIPSHLDGVVGAGTINSAGLEVSYDDGKTWQAVPVVKSQSGWTANFLAPATGYVSLRATAADSAGNKITQEVIRAYGLTQH